jgi:ABC-2 type transport system permease protein
MFRDLSIQRVGSVARKEMLHIRRDPATLFFALLMPVMEMFLLGYAIDTNVRHIRTVIMDLAQNQESRMLIQKFENSEDFKVVKYVYAEKDLRREIVAGRARVGISIPENYSRRLQAGDVSQISIQVDGSESSVAGEMINVGSNLALRESLERVLGGRNLPVDNRPRVLGSEELPVDARPRILFNPDTRSPNFFLPGLMVVFTQIMAVMLTANAIVREKENGTLEQLFMTPVRSSELIIGKLVPYLGLTFLEFCGIALLMRVVFQVPVHGHFFTLLALTLPFVLAMLGFGLWVSTKASTREAAGQMSMATVMPAIFLSGYVFPLDSMPRFFYYAAQIIPTTWLIDAARGVIIRGAGWAELGTHALVLWSMALVSIVLSMLRFRKQLG